MTDSPLFGQADLTNCERELIHLPGSIQPHGVLFVLHEPDLRILSCSGNTDTMLGVAPDVLLGNPLAEFSPLLSKQLSHLARTRDLKDSAPLRGELSAGQSTIAVDCAAHRTPDDRLILECMPRFDIESTPLFEIDHAPLVEILTDGVEKVSAASSITSLASATTQTCRDLIGFDRVMVYKFDPDGHGEIIAEARDPRLDSLLGHRYPASDIPQRARALYISNRVRVLVDATDEQAPLVSKDDTFSADQLDMSMCYLRSMSPLHLQYLQNMGVTATLVVSLVRNDELWGLIAAHHYAPRNVSFAIRTGAQLLGEAVSTRIAAIENYAKAQVAIQVRRLEQRLIDATYAEGDWQLALFRNPMALLRPLAADGAALVYEGQVQAAGDVPSTPELRSLANWIDEGWTDSVFSTNSIAKADARFSSLTSIASGVVAIKLSANRPDYLIWFRKEQLQSVTWAGDPNKAVIGNDPKDLSPRRSFAAWSEIVRGTALPWASNELAMASAIGAALIDIIVQVNAVQLLVADQQLASLRTTIDSSKEAVMIFGADEKTLFCNQAMQDSTGINSVEIKTIEQFARRFTDPGAVSRIFQDLDIHHSAWQGQQDIKVNEADIMPMRVRVDLIPNQIGVAIGFVVTMLDASARANAERARLALQESLRNEYIYSEELRQHGSAITTGPDSPTLRSALVTNASMAAMDIADGLTDESVAPIFEEVEASTRRAARLERWIADSFDASETPPATPSTGKG